MISMVNQFEFPSGERGGSVVTASISDVT